MMHIDGSLRCRYGVRDRGSGCWLPRWTSRWTARVSMHSFRWRSMWSPARGKDTKFHSPQFS